MEKLTAIKGEQKMWRLRGCTQSNKNESVKNDMSIVHIYVNSGISLVLLTAIAIPNDEYEFSFFFFCEFSLMEKKCEWFLINNK